MSWDRLESFARERDVNVRIERRKQDHAWICTVTNGVPAEVQTSGSPRAKPSGRHCKRPASNGELAEGGFDDPLLEVRVALENEAEHRREDEQQREDREEAVVGDRGGVVAALVVGVLLKHREREATERCRCWNRSKALHPCVEAAH